MASAGTGGEMKAVVARVEGGGRVQEEEEEEAIPDRPHLAPLRLALPGRSLAARSRRQSSRAALQPAPGDAGGATPPPPLGPSLQDAKFRLSPSSVPAQRTTATTASGNILGSGDEP
ncbi:unnamed protein product [Lampetra fluviatilis]